MFYWHELLLFYVVTRFKDKLLACWLIDLAYFLLVKAHGHLMTFCMFLMLLVKVMTRMITTWLMMY